MVPSNMFVLLNDIIAVQTRSMKVLPARLERAELREFAQFEERYRLARSTHQVFFFSFFFFFIDRVRAIRRALPPHPQHTPGVSLWRDKQKY